MLSFVIQYWSRKREETKPSEGSLRRRRWTHEICHSVSLCLFVVVLGFSILIKILTQDPFYMAWERKLNKIQSVQLQWCLSWNLRQNRMKRNQLCILPSHLDFIFDFDFLLLHFFCTSSLCMSNNFLWFCTSPPLKNAYLFCSTFLSLLIFRIKNHGIL